MGSRFLKGMLLAAGLGERMRPLTDDRPKPALTVLGRRLAVQILRRFRDAGIEQAVVNLHYKPQALRDLLGDGGSGGLPEIAYSEEQPEILGSGGGLRYAAELLRDSDPILIHNADFLSDIDFQQMTDEHRDRQAAATMALIPARPGYPNIAIDQEGWVISIGGLPEVDPARVAGRFMFSGCHLLGADQLARLPQGVSDIKQLYRPLAQEGRLLGYLHPGYWWEFGTPRLYLDGHLDLLHQDESQRSRIGDHDPIRSTAGCDRVAIGAGVELDEGVKIEGAASLSMASRLGEDCLIRDCVVLEESWIGPECQLERCIVAPHSELPAGYRAKDALIYSPEDSGEVVAIPLGDA